jgi:hypothetical protein
MVPSSALVVAADGERLSCDIFSLGDTIRFGSIEFIADRFGGLSLSCMGDGLDAAVMGITDGRPPSPLQANVGDYTKEFHTALDGGRRVDLPSPRRHSTGASTVPAMTIPWLETTTTTQPTTTTPLRPAVPRHEPPHEEESVHMKT